MHFTIFYQINKFVYNKQAICQHLTQEVHFMSSSDTISALANRDFLLVFLFCNQYFKYRHMNLSSTLCNQNKLEHRDVSKCLIAWNLAFSQLEKSGKKAFNDMSCFPSNHL